MKEKENKSKGIITNSFDDLFQSKFQELINKTSKNGISAIYSSDYYYKEQIKEYLTDFNEEKEIEYLDIKISTYLEKENDLAIKQGKIYFSDMYNMYKKQVKLTPTLLQEFCYYDKKKLIFIPIFRPIDKKGSYLFNPYAGNFDLKKDIQKKENQNANQKKIGSISEKFFKEGKIEHDIIPSYASPYQFDIIVSGLFFIKALKKSY